MRVVDRVSSLLLRGKPMSTRVQSNWGKPYRQVLTSGGPTLFEKTASEMRLSPAEWVSSLALKEWAAKNKNDHYVPPALLEAWGMEADEWT